MESSNQAQCASHPHRPASFVCMDSNCIKTPICCIICIKNDHNTCNDKCILSVSELSSKITIKNTDTSELDEFKKTILGILEDKKEDMLTKYKEYSEKSLNFGVCDQIDVNALNNLETLKGLKDYCNFRVTDDDQIEISPQFDPTGPSLDLSLIHI